MAEHFEPESDSIVHLGQRGHIFKATIGQNTAVIANIYAPTGQTREKIEFFEQVRQEITRARDPTDEVYLMGDFNTVFAPYELRSRSYSTQEQRHSQLIKQIVDSLSLEDAWLNNRTTHTWRQPGTQKTSRLDRIYHLSNWKRTNIEADWTFTNSDHAAVTVSFTEVVHKRKQKILRLNPTLLQERIFKGI